MTWRESEDFARETGEPFRLLRGMIRRMAVTLTSAVKWQLLGQRGGSGGDERPNFEPFTGIGFYSRPPASGNPEAIVTAVGGAGTSVIVATRDEKTRKKSAAIAEGETTIYNDKAVVVVKQDGTVEIRLVGGVAIALPTMADFNALRTYVVNQFSATGGHTHAVAGAATTTITAVAVAGGLPPSASPPAPVGTSALKAQ